MLVAVGHVFKTNWKANLLTEKKITNWDRKRTEVRSGQADSHLGHIFEDGPKELGDARFIASILHLNFILIY